MRLIFPALNITSRHFMTWHSVMCQSALWSGGSQAFPIMLWGLQSVESNCYAWLQNLQLSWSHEVIVAGACMTSEQVGIKSWHNIMVTSDRFCAGRAQPNDLHCSCAWHFVMISSRSEVSRSVFRPQMTGNPDSKGMALAAYYNKILVK